MSSLPPSGVTCVSQRKSEYVRESMWIRLNNYSVLKGKKERGTVGVLVVSVGPRILVSFPASLLRFVLGMARERGGGRVLS